MRLIAATIAALLAACAPAVSQRSHTSAGTAATIGGEREAGRAIFAARCASCHGATGKEGGMGPSLRFESTRMDFNTTVSWIEDPQPPMPQLYPKVLNERDVRDVAAYVQSL